MPRLDSIVIDCGKASSLARWWAELLDDYRVAAYDDDEIERLRSLGFRGPDDDPLVMLEPVSGHGPRIFFQQVPELKAVKNRAHIDLCSDHLEDDIKTAVEAKATLMQRFDSHVVLADPEGNEFCMARSSHRS